MPFFYIINNIQYNAGFIKGGDSCIQYFVDIIFKKWIEIRPGSLGMFTRLAFCRPD